MTSPTTINETIAMLRRRVQEIDRLIENFERQKPASRVVPKQPRCGHSGRANVRSLPDPDLGRIRA
jgi:hypothetical protein